MLSHYFVIFNTNENGWRKNNPNVYYNICLKDLENEPDVEIVNRPGYHLNVVFRFLFNLFNSKRIGSHFKMPFKSIWFPFYFKTKKIQKPFCFITMNPDLSEKYYAYLKKKYKNCSIVCLHRDSVHLYDNNPLRKHFSFNRYYDFEFSFDPGEAEKYRLFHFMEFESKIDVPKSKKYPLFDVFFAGKAKDRLNIIIEVYKRLQSQGLKCFFYITGAKDNQKEYQNEIVYSDNPMPYTDMLYYSVNSRCILEINYGNMVGYTSRFLESIIYKKKLITNNPEIKKTIYYSEGQILCFNNVSEINKNFVYSHFVPFNYNNSFSPIHLIRRIDTMLQAEDSSGKRNS